jgi:hypothetical protein
VHYDWHTDALTIDVVGPFNATGVVDLGGSISVTRQPVAGEPSTTIGAVDDAVLEG